MEQTIKTEWPTDNGWHHVISKDIEYEGMFEYIPQLGEQKMIEGKKTVLDSYDDKELRGQIEDGKWKYNEEAKNVVMIEGIVKYNNGIVQGKRKYYQQTNSNHLVKGTTKLADGTIFEGEYEYIPQKNGVFLCEGTVTLNDGRIFRGKFNYDSENNLRDWSNENHFKGKLRPVERTVLEEQRKKWNRSKVLVVGNKRVGKTSVIKWLIKGGNAFDENRKSTVGAEIMTTNTDVNKWNEIKHERVTFRCEIVTQEIDMDDYDVEDSEEEELTPEKDIDIKSNTDQLSRQLEQMSVKENLEELMGNESRKTVSEGFKRYTSELSLEKDMEDDDDGSLVLNIWDFGGQKIFHHMQQFLRTDRGIYILVFDASKDVEPEEVKYWIMLHPPSAPLFRMKEDEYKYLKWNEVKYLGANKAGIKGDDDLNEALQYLSDMGSVVWHRISPSNNDNSLVFLKPEWVVDVLKSVITKKSLLQMRYNRAPSSANLSKNDWIKCVSGIFTDSLLTYLWKDLESMERQILRYLLIHLNLAINVSSGDLLITCMVPKDDDPSHPCWNFDDSDLVCLFRFQFIPHST